ncbi:hypothetical protein EF910_29350 [Streptomyces sp. WAC07149]|uniref:hypothetical protein n=1 Tax=Streptomyces sp. WAC07149 TaxID=2487425 RepID=UPI000F7A9ACA|nr:hypothetical protein [Streptomyces sp. WAC07149]RST01098.1 hypothetical protein EF910_29350 [Streptomyces sp. WAC07149]
MTGPAARGSGQRLAWYTAAALSAALVVSAAAWQAGTGTGVRTGTAVGGSGGRTVTAVEVVAGPSDVSVTPRGDAQVGYRADLAWSFRRPEVEESWLGDTLKLTPHCPDGSPGFAAGAGCSVRLAVTVPAGVPLKVSGGSGRISVSGMAAAVDAETGAGTLVLADLRGPLRARVGDGTLRATGLTVPQADIRAGAGRADARFAAPPEQVTARAGAGRLDIVLPTDTRYRVSCRAGLGRCEAADALNDPAAARALDIAVDVGHATASYRPDGS